MLRRPLPSTLFPYTTLFRSTRVGTSSPRRAAAVLEVNSALDVIPIRDRKSTRLNSSHLVISYAVFCLKKKKEQGKKFRNNAKDATVHQRPVQGSMCSLSSVR